MDHDDHDKPKWKRLHPLSPLFHVAELLRTLVIVLLLALFASGRGTDWWIAFGLVGAAGLHLVRHFLLRYRLTDSELVIREGLFFRSERHIPISRINNVDLVQGVLARRLGLAEARLQTASGGTAEATLRMLTLVDVEYLQSRISHKSDAQGSDDERSGIDPGGTLVLALGPGELMRMGLIVNKGMAMVGVAMGVAWQLDLLDRWADMDRLSSLLGLAPGWQVIVAGLIAVAVVLAGLSVVWTLLRFYGFELRQKHDDFHLSCGLLTRRSATIPRDRIQFVSVRSSPIHRMLGRVSIRVETGGGVQDQSSLFGRQWFAPLVRLEQADQVLESTGYPTLGQLKWDTLAPGAVRRSTKRGVIQGAFGLAAVGWIVFPFGLIGGFAILAFSVWHARAWVRRARWTNDQETVGLTTGVFFRATSLTRKESVQVAGVGETPFDRRRQMASVRIDTAGGGPLTRRIAIPYLMRETADSLAHELATQHG